MARAGVDPALEPFRAALDRPRVRRLAGQDRPRRRRVVRLEKRVEPLLGGRAVRIERQGNVRRAGHRVGRAPGGARRLLYAREVLGEELHAGPGREPRVEARRLAQRRRSAAADPDRRAARPVGLGLHRHVVEREVLALKAHVIATPERLTDLERLEKAADPPLEGHAGGGELLADRRIVGGEADAQDDAALRRAIERADDMGQHHRIAQRRQEHTGAEAHAPGAPGDRRHQRERLVSGPGDQRVPDPHGVEACRLRALGHGQERRRLRMTGHDGLARGYQHTELDSHRYLPSARGLVSSSRTYSRLLILPLFSVRTIAKRPTCDVVSTCVPPHA